MKYCLQCGAPTLRFENNHVFRCGQCQFEMYFNTAAAVGAVIRRDDEILMSVRAHAPAKGKLDFPGGFVDPGESLESALVRELEEELNFTPERWTYLASFSNTYPYKSLTYTTCDAFFLIEVDARQQFQNNEEITELRWMKLDELTPDTLAFPSGRQLLPLLA